MANRRAGRRVASLPPVAIWPSYLRMLPTGFTPTRQPASAPDHLGDDTVARWSDICQTL